MKTIYVNNTDLTRNKRSSYLTEDVVSGGTTFRVQSILGFESLTTSSGQIVILGEIGNERSEILRTSNSTPPGATYKEITLRDPLNFDHPQDTKVTITDFNRASFEWSATVSGTKSTLTAYPSNIQADQLETLYVDSAQSSGFYFTRFNESIGNTYSDYSDPVAFGGYDDNSVASIKKRALDELNEEVDGNVITNEYLNQCLWVARREYHNSLGKRPFRQVFNKVIGTALTGSYRLEVPTDMEDPYGPQNLYGVRVGANSNMNWQDKKEWDNNYISKPHSTLDVPYVVNTSTSIWLANGRDFSASATINVEGSVIGLSRITGSQNSFRIITHGSWSASAGSDVWENTSFGLPDRFTVWADPQGSAYIYFNRPIDTAYVNQNIYGDYYRTLVPYNSDADILDEPVFDMFVDYLKYKIKERRSRGQIAQDKKGQIVDIDFLTWQQKKQGALSSEYISNKIRLVPGYNSNLPSDYNNSVYY